MTGFGAGWTATPPIESEGIVAEPALMLKTGRVSVSGVKVTFASGPATVVDFQTPPPVVPR
jgi:hypothetical protein